MDAQQTNRKGVEMKTLDKIKSAAVVIGAYLFVYAVYAAIACAALIPVLIIFALVKYLMN
jgi:hypothetical protein